MKSQVVSFSFLTFKKQDNIFQATADVAIRKCKKNGNVFRSATVLSIEKLCFGLLKRVKADYRYI